MAPLQARQQQLVDKTITAARKRHAAGGWWIGPLLVVATPGYLLLQVLLARWWRGRWRVAALLPLLVMVPAYVFCIIALLAGSNLWPLVVLFLSPVAFAWLLVLLPLYWWPHRSSPP